MAGMVEELARAIPDADTRAEALAGLAVVLGSLNSPAALERAMELTREIPNPASRLQALTGLAQRLATAGDLAGAGVLAREAEQLARRSPDMWRTQAVIRLVAALVDNGDTAQALYVAGFAERSARGIRDAGWRVQACAELVGLIAAAGDRPRALRLATAVEDDARDTPDEVQALTQLVGPIAGAGDRHRALRLAADVERLALAIPSSERRAQVLGQLASVLITIGDPIWALRVAQRITVGEWRAQVLRDGVLRLTREQRASSFGGIQEHQEVVRRMVADVLCTPLWTEALPVVGRLEPAALSRLADALGAADERGDDRSGERPPTT
jgi:ATP/maltotriose-dependent transcriptional regulator MalT